MRKWRHTTWGFTPYALAGLLYRASFRRLVVIFGHLVSEFRNTQESGVEADDKHIRQPAREKA